MEQPVDDVISVLLVEDNPADVHLVREVLALNGKISFETTHVGRLDEALALLELEKQHFAAVLLDLTLPDEKGIDSFRRMKAAVPDMPIIILSCLDNEEIALTTMRQGAQDYLTKGENSMAILPHAIRYAIERQRVESELEAARRHAEAATRLKDKFLSVVAHDLQSPLTSVSTEIKIATMDTDEPLPPRHAQTLQHVLKTVEDMSGMLEELISIARIQAGAIIPHPRFFDAAFAAMSVKDRLTHAAINKNISIVNDIPPHTRLYADLNLFSEALFNVVSNAIKFSHPGGTVRISAAAGKPGTVAVRDEGVGMDAERLEKIFKPEEKTTTTGTAGEKGTGLGMPLAQDIMQAHRGTIRAESAPGAGSVFYLTLPEVQPEILIVDDDRLTRIMLKGLLQDLDARILEAEDGERALALLEKTTPHLMIIDAMMPVMDGFELLERLHKNPKTHLIPTIFVTANSNVAARNKAFTLGADDFITKPIRMEELIPRVRRFLI